MTRHYYRARLIAKGPFVGVTTFFSGPVVDGEELDRSPRWQCVVGSETTGRAVLMGDAIPIEVDGVSLRNIEGITSEDYHYLLAHADYAAKHDPSMPDAAPRQTVNLKRMPSIF